MYLQIKKEPLTQNVVCVKKYFFKLWNNAVGQCHNTYEKQNSQHKTMEANPRGKNKLWPGKILSGAKAQKIRNEKKIKNSNY